MAFADTLMGIFGLGGGSQLPTYDAWKDMSLNDRQGFLQYNALQQQQPGLMDMLGGLGNIFGIYNQWSMGNQYMDLMRDQLGIAQEQWQTTKDEIGRINEVRDRISAEYAGRPYTPPASENPANPQQASNTVNNTPTLMNLGGKAAGSY